MKFYLEFEGMFSGKKVKGRPMPFLEAYKSYRNIKTIMGNG